jgi:hypothetical protein
MGDNGATALPSGWRVEIDGGSPLPRGAYSMIEVDAQTCAFEQPGGPSFEMLAADVVVYEKAGILHFVGPLAGNDNSLVNRLDPIPGCLGKPRGECVAKPL